jgi:hypothetical protein
MTYSSQFRDGNYRFISRLHFCPKSSNCVRIALQSRCTRVAFRLFPVAFLPLRVRLIIIKNGSKTLISNILLRDVQKYGKRQNATQKTNQNFITLDN